MSNRAPYVPANFVASASDLHFGGGGVGGGFSRMDSENEDLRGVIDDLTVENKRLKQMIRSRQRTSHASPSDASTAQDKLFEVRMHGLPAEKRRELEFLLKNFATSVHTSVPSKAHSNSNISGSNASGSQVPALRTTPTTDSGYASNSNSGGAGFLPTQSMLHKSSNTKNVQSYLKDIPDTLLPKSNPLMSERAKQAIIVRRLEQLFTGRAAAAGVHDQPIQQQEISHSAARADRLQDAKDNKKRKAEGSREARVMPPDTKVNFDALSPFHPQDPKKKDTATDLLSRPGSPEQRPTRPLDLDIHRAQIAADNIAYLSHLGMSAPALGGSTREGEANWMYLNLLAGLAQLHTLNVTPDQIRKAVKKLSKHLELSKDGGKVRWTGGNEATKFPTEDEKAIEVADVATHESADDAGTGGTSSKRSKTNSTSNAAETSNTTSDDKMSGLQTSSGSKNLQLTSETSNLQGSSVPTKQTSTLASSAFDYKPIVYRQKLRHDLEDEMRDSDESYDSPSLGSSALVYALSQSNLNQQNKEEGLITFFNNPFFCSDFSWERDPSNMQPPRPVVIGETLGLPVPAALPESPLRDADATYFTTQFANTKPFDADVLSPSQKEKFERSLPVFPELRPISTAGEEETVPLSFDVCGLGGITPDDNFVLDVKIEREPAPMTGQGVITKTLPFSKRRYIENYLTTMTSCEKIDLLPSKLPPPSYIFFTSSSSSGNNEMNDDEDSEEEDATSDSSSSPMVDEQYPAPPDFLQQFSGSSRENIGDDENDSKSSSEIDMLAIARKEYPREVAEQERVYMINQPGGVAGSLAATVGASRSSSSVHRAPAATSMDSRMGSVGDDSDSDDYDDMSDS